MHGTVSSTAQSPLTATVVIILHQIGVITACLLLAEVVLEDNVTVLIIHTQYGTDVHLQKVELLLFLGEMLIQV